MYVAAGTAIASFFGSKSKEKKAKKATEDDRKFQREMWKRQLLEAAKQRKYKEDAAGSYAQFNKDPSIVRPAGTNFEQEVNGHESLVMSPWAKPKK